MVPNMNLTLLRQSLGWQLLQLKQIFWIYDDLYEQGLINTYIFKNMKTDTIFTIVHLENALFFTLYEI